MSHIERVIRRFETEANYVDARVFHSTENILQFHNGSFVESSIAENLGVGIRVMIDGKWGFASCDGKEARDIEYVAERALKNAKLNPGNTRRYLASAPSVRCKQSLSTQSPAKFNDFTERRNLVKRVFNAAKISEDTRVFIGFEEKKTNTLFMNSEGSEIESNTVKTSLRTRVHCGEGSTSGSACEAMALNKEWDALSKKNLEEYAESIAKRATKNADAMRGNKLESPMILDPVMSGALVHEAIGHLAEADHVFHKDSFTYGIESKIAPENLSITDNPALKDGFGSYKYDDEGVEAKTEIILENGWFINLLHSRTTAYLYETESNGRCRAQNHQSPPIVRCSNLIIAPGEIRVDEILEDVGEGIFLKGVLSGNRDETTDSVFLSPQESYRIENGELTTAIKGIHISGQTLKLLNSIKLIANDTLHYPMVCGKRGQIIETGITGRTMLLENNDFWG